MEACTEASHEHRDHDPSSSLHKLKEVDDCGEGEQDGEQYGCGHGRVITVVLEPLCIGAVRHCDTGCVFLDKGGKGCFD